MQPPVPDPLLTCALLRRAMTDVERIRQLRESKAALQTLLQRGQIGDDLWAAANAAEKDLELELHEVAGEANTFRPGWGQIIFAQAQEMVSHERLKETYRDIEKMREQERKRSEAADGIVPPATVRIGRSVPVGRQIQPFALPPPAPPEPQHQHDHGHSHPHAHPPPQPQQIEVAPPAASQPNGFAQAPQPRSEPPSSPPQPLHPMQNGAGSGYAAGASIVELSDDDEAEGTSASTSPAKPKKAKVRAERRCAR